MVHVVGVLRTATPTNSGCATCARVSMRMGPRVRNLGFRGQGSAYALLLCRSPWKRLAEVAALVFVTASTWFLVTYWSPCAPLPDAARPLVMQPRSRTDAITAVISHMGALLHLCWKWVLTGPQALPCAVHTHAMGFRVVSLHPCRQGCIGSVRLAGLIWLEASGDRAALVPCKEPQ